MGWLGHASSPVVVWAASLQGALLLALTPDSLSGWLTSTVEVPLGSVTDSVMAS